MKTEHWLVKYSRKVNAELAAAEVRLIDDLACNALVVDIDRYPHAFVLACCMDRQVSSDRAWRIPSVIKGLYKEFTIDELSEVTLEDYKSFFREETLHRYNDTMAEVFYKAVHRIKDQYDGDASRIWQDRPSSAAVVYRFLQFDGVGVKIANMAANILARQFGIEFSDYYSIDVSPDVHVFRIFERTGLTEKDASRDEVIYKARELNPEFPGIIDAACWRIGRQFCHPSSPDCEHCPVSADCPKLISIDPAKK